MNSGHGRYSVAVAQVLAILYTQSGDRSYHVYFQVWIIESLVSKRLCVPQGMCRMVRWGVERKY